MPTRQAPDATGAVPDLTAETLRVKQQAGAERARAAGLPVREGQLPREGLPPGTPVPAFTAVDLEGRGHAFAEFLGRRTLLVFSDVGCGPCEMLAPELVRLDRSASSDDLQIVMVSRGGLEANRAKAQAFAFEFPVLLQRHWEISRPFGIYATPVGYLIDERGVTAAQAAVGVGETLRLVDPAAHVDPTLGAVAWPSSVRFISHGVRIGIRLSDPAIEPEVARLLPPGSRALNAPQVDTTFSLVVGRAKQPGALCEAPGEDHLLFRGSAPVTRIADLSVALETLESQLHFEVAQGAPRHLFVHAGVVAVGERAILLPGRSGSGKSSLVAALIRAGATYYSDEYAVLDAQGRVHAYPRWLTLRPDPTQAAGRYPAAALGGRVGRRPLPVGLIARTTYRSGARWRPRAIGPAQALLMLLENTVVARRRPEWALTVLQRAVAGADAIASSRGEADAIARQLISRLG